MKGAIGNSMILNIVITFIILFFSLLIGSMAYSKAYKAKNFIINSINESEGKMGNEFKSKVSNYLGKIGYPLATKSESCNHFYKNNSSNNYMINTNTTVGGYDYCIYLRMSDSEKYSPRTQNYKVVVYMKLDLPVIGGMIRIPITGDSMNFLK